MKNGVFGEFGVVAEAKTKLEKDVNFKNSSYELGPKGSVFGEKDSRPSAEGKVKIPSIINVDKPTVENKGRKGPA